MIRLSVIIIIMLAAVETIAQKQGIEGKVVWIEGNQMPGPGNTREKPKGVSREIHVYEATHQQDVKQVNGFYTDVKSKLVAIAQTNANGEFCIKLPPGEYSVFTKEPEGLFANLFDDQGRINTISVEKRRFTPVTIEINYKAVF